MVVVVVGISFDKDMIERIDQERGDIPRSRFIKRLIERGYQDLERERRKK